MTVSAADQPSKTAETAGGRHFGTFTSEAATRDVDDDYLVALAREHSADFIVTGDKDLLEWEDQTPPAITPAAFEQALVGRGN